MSSWLHVVNPKAGTVNSGGKDFHSYLATNLPIDHQTHIVMTDANPDVRQQRLVSAIKSTGSHRPLTVCVWGGDGTAQDALQSVLGYRYGDWDQAIQHLCSTPDGVVDFMQREGLRMWFAPAGSVSDLANNYGQPHSDFNQISDGASLVASLDHYFCADLNAIILRLYDKNDQPIRTVITPHMVTIDDHFVGRAFEQTQKMRGNRGVLKRTLLMIRDTFRIRTFRTLAHLNGNEESHDDSLIFIHALPLATKVAAYPGVPIPGGIGLKFLPGYGNRFINKLRSGLSFGKIFSLAALRGNLARWWPRLIGPEKLSSGLSPGRQSRLMPGESGHLKFETGVHLTASGEYIGQAYRVDVRPLLFKGAVLMHPDSLFCRAQGLLTGR